MKHDSQRTIRIAFIRSHYRFDGGAERILTRIFPELKKHYSLAIHIITQKWQSADQTHLHIIECPKKGLLRHSRIKYFIQCVQKKLKQESFDIVQSHERIPGCQIYRAGDGVHRHWLELRKQNANPFQRFFWKHSLFHNTILAAERSLFAHPDLQTVICNSNQIKKEILHYYPETDPAKLILIRNGIDNKQFAFSNSQGKKQARSRLNLKNDALVLLFVGSGFDRKGLGILLNALALVKDWQLLVVGKDSKIKRYQQLVNKLDLTERVRFEGKQVDVIPYYQAADLLVHPALYDPAPNVVLEAMSVGRGVICSDQSGTSELIESGKNGFVCSTNQIPKLVDLLEKCKDRTLLENLGKSARTTAEAYPIENMTDQLFQLYADILKTNTTTLK